MHVYQNETITVLSWIQNVYQQKHDWKYFWVSSDKSDNFP